MRKGSQRRILAMLLAGVMIISGTAQPKSAAAAKKPKLSKTKVTITAGKKVTLKLKNAKKKVTWKSSNTKVAKVSSKGVVRGIKKGTAKIVAKSAGKKYTCKVTVKKKSASSGSTAQTPSATNKPATTTPTPKPTTKPGATAGSTEPATLVKQNSTSISYLPSTLAASAEDTLTVGKMAVKLGMTSAEVEKSIGAKPDRTETTPQGFTALIYNPSFDYTNYLMIGLANDKVVEMSTISQYFSYENIVSSGVLSGSLEDAGWSGSDISKYYYSCDSEGSTVSGVTPAYAYDTDHARIIAFTDCWSTNAETYGIQILDKNYTWDKVMQPKECTYNAAVAKDMANQVFDFAQAYRIYHNLGQLTRNAAANTVAAANGTLRAEGSDYNASAFGKALDAVNIDWTAHGEIYIDGTSDAISSINSFIETQDQQGKLLSLKYDKTGVGVAFDETNTYKIFTTMTEYTE